MQYNSNRKRSKIITRKLAKSGSAVAAAAIRAELKEKFPKVRFSVKSRTFSMGNAVDINWEDGPSSREVEAITDKYQYGHFDGMTDMYEYSNVSETIPQAKYVHARRSMSDQTKTALEADVAKLSPDYERNNEVYRIFRKTSLPVEAKVTGFYHKGKSGLIEDVIGIDYEGRAESIGANVHKKAVNTKRERKQVMNELKEEIQKTVDFLATTDLAIYGQVTEGTKEAANVQKVQLLKPVLGVDLVQYSDRAIALFGNTRPIKDALSALGGTYNPYLKKDGEMRPGWVFSITKIDQVKQLIGA